MKILDLKDDLEIEKMLLPPEYEYSFSNSNWTLYKRWVLDHYLIWKLNYA